MVFVGFLVGAIGTMSGRQNGLYKPTDLTYFLAALRRTGGRSGPASRANFWHAMRGYLQQKPMSGGRRPEASGQGS